MSLLSRALISASFVLVGCFLAVPSRADQIVLISSTPTLELFSSPLSFSFDYDLTTRTLVGTPAPIDFAGEVFTFVPTSGDGAAPPTFHFQGATPDFLDSINIGETGLFQQPPQVLDFPAVGTYGGWIVEFDGGNASGDGVVSNVAEPSSLLLLAGGFTSLLGLRRKRIG